VGKDQKQHVEITRDIAERFNKIYGRGKGDNGDPSTPLRTHKSAIFPLPEAYIPEEVATVMGTDGKRKMSKSLGNIISIFEPEEVIRKQVMSCFTDPTRAHANDPGHVEGNMVFTYLEFFGDRQTVDEYKEAYRRGKVADVEIKEYLFKSLMVTFGPARERYEELKNNPEEIKRILENGREKAYAVASQTMKEVRKAVGLINMYSVKSVKFKVKSLGENDSKKITIEDFGRVEIRVGKVIEAENVAKSEKLIKLTVDFGPSAASGSRTIYTGVREYGYTPEDFAGKQFMFVVNLEYRKMPGGESQGMILAVDGVGDKPLFIPAEELPVGAKVR
jgi:methionine--tRNA ligase beta chain